MRQTKLILIEGLPGSGKSTLAQFLTRARRHDDVAVHWWYEEDCDHPVYVFHDREELSRTVERLNDGDHEGVISDVLEQWKRFAEMVKREDGVVLIDSCLFGYLSWSLFPLNVPEERISAYVAEVVELIALLNPCLIYLYQDDVGASLRRIVDRRGDATEQRLLEQSTNSPYGRNRGFSGFDGTVQYWTAYRRLTDSMFDACPFTKVAIETTAGAWESHQQHALAFLRLSAAEAPQVSPDDLARVVGVYRYSVESAEGAVEVRLDGDRLILSGMPEVWRDTPLIPVAKDRFEIESMPFELCVESDAGGCARRIVVGGPELLRGPIPRLLERYER